MPDPFTIRIFVPDGEPSGIRVIDRMNWTGVGVTFPRSKWLEVKNRDEFDQPGVYILRGYSETNEDLPTLYIGQADGVKSRINNHFINKEFWDLGIVFVSTSGGLNRAHITWLEYALINRAKQANRCILDNDAMPNEPALTEAEKADTRGFLNEILQILPLVDLRAFESTERLFVPPVGSKDIELHPPSRDTIIVPARKEGFEDVFIGESCWYAIRISGGMLSKIKYIAVYQVEPVSAITHFAPVHHIEPYGDEGKYKVVFSDSAEEIGPIPRSDAPPGAMQASRYTNFEKLKSADKLNDLFEF